MPTADAVVIGGGISGVATAYFLAKAGRRVILVEKGVIAGEASGRNGGHIVPVAYPALTGNAGPRTPMGILAVKLWRELALELPDPIELRMDGSLHVLLDEVEGALLDDLPGTVVSDEFPVEALTPAQCLRLVPGLSERVVGGVYSPMNGQANPILATKALARAARDLGADLWTGTRVTGITVRNGRIASVQTTGGAVETPVVVNCAGAWASLIGRMVGLEIPSYPRRIQMMVSEALPPITTLAFGGNGIYARQAATGQLHFGGGGPLWEPAVTRFDKTVSAPTMQHTARLMAELMPGLGDLRILRSWSGVIESTPDGYPIVDAPGQPKGFVTASGFTGIGFGMGPATGKVASELALTGTTATDISGLRLARFASQPAWRLEAYQDWRRDPEGATETGAWDVAGVVARTGRAAVEGGLR